MKHFFWLLGFFLTSQIFGLERVELTRSGPRFFLKTAEGITEDTVYELAFQAKSSCEDLEGRLFLYSSSLISRHQTTRILQKHHLISNAKGCLARLILPLFFVDDLALPALQFEWDRQDFDSLRLALSWYKGRAWKMAAEKIEITDVVLSRIFLEEPQIILDELRGKYRAWPETSAGQFLFFLAAVIPALILGFGFLKSLRIRFLAIFLGPVLLLGASFPFLGVNLAEQVEEAMLGRARSELQSASIRLRGLGEAAEANFVSRIEDFEGKFPELKKSMESQGISFMKCESQKNPEALAHPLEKILDRLSEEDGLQMIMWNDSTSFATKPLRHLQHLRTWVGRGIHHLVSTEFKSDPDQQLLSEVRLRFQPFNMALKQMREVLGSSRDLDSFLYGPRRLFPFNPVQYGVAPFRNNKSFWSWIADDSGEIWYILGGYDEVQIARVLIELLRKFPLEESYSIGMYGENQSPDWPIKGRQMDVLHASVALAMSSSRPILRPIKFHDSEAYITVDPLRELSNTWMALGLDLNRVYQDRQQELNRIGLQAVMLLFFMLVAAYFVGTALARPLMELTEGLKQVSDGNLQKDLKRRGQDELAQITDLFNRMLASLREKELITRFLSVSARRNLSRDEQTSYRSQALVLFVGIPYDSKFSADRLDETMLRILVDHVQKTAIQLDGFVDKFTGNAFLIVLENPQPEMVGSLLKKLKTRLEEAREILLPFIDCPLRLGIGASLGEVVLGHVGARERKDFTCIGNTVNMAARLMNLPSEAAVTVFVDRPAKDVLTQVQCSLKAAGNIQIKGKEEAQEVYELA